MIICFDTDPIRKNPGYNNFAKRIPLNWDDLSIIPACYISNWLNVMIFINFWPSKMFRIVKEINNYQWYFWTWKAKLIKYALLSRQACEIWNMLCFSQQFHVIWRFNPLMNSICWLMQENKVIVLSQLQWLFKPWC